jgi:quercetin dioxygenase-like cupin family protein
METYWYFDLLIDILVDGEQTNGSYSVLDVWGPPGFGTVLHVHRDAEEGYYVTEGEVTVWYGDQTAVLHAGDFLLLPRGVPHTLKHTGPGEARMLGICTPVGFEDFVRSFGTPALKRELPVVTEPLDVKRAVALADAAGIDILGPPGKLPTELAPPPLA